MIQPPAPGIYENVPFETYLEWDAISASRISMARRSLLHFKENIALEPTPAIRIGSLSHCGRFEPLALAKRYAVMPNYERDPDNVTTKGERSTSKNTKYYEQMADKFVDANRGKEIVSEVEYERMVAIVTQLSKHPRACQYLGGDGSNELAIVWIDPETGLTCKARLDAFRPERQRITDLKTYTPQQSNKTPHEKFNTAIAMFGYHRQLSHYRKGVHVLVDMLCTTAFVVVENAKPHCVMAAPLSDDWLIIGDQENAETLRAIKAAKESDVWPGYDSPDAWYPPQWYGGDVELLIHEEAA